MNEAAPVPPNEESRGTPVSVDDSNRTAELFKDVFEKITEKKSKTSKYFYDSIKLTFDDIAQLHYKIMQNCRQYHVKGITFSASIYYEDDSHDDFSTFEQLEKLCPAGGHAVEGILIKYAILICPPNKEVPQVYAISIRFASRIILEKKLRAELFGAPPKFIRQMGNRTASIDVEFSDYIVSRAIIRTFEDWFITLGPKNKPTTLDVVQSLTYWIPRLTRMTAAIICAIAVEIEAQNFLSKSDHSIEVVARIFSYSCLATYVVYTLSSWLGTAIERAIDSLSELSYVEINKADKLAVTKAKDQNRLNKIKGAAYFVGCIALNALFKYIFAQIYQSIF